MKTSQKILISVGVIITTLLIGSMVVIRDDIQTFFASKAVEMQYKIVPVDKFNKLDFSASWIVSVKQGGEYKLEIAIDDSTALKPLVKNADETLYFSIDTIQSKENAGSIKARITTPSLKAIRSVRGTQIHLRDFQSDSLMVDIEDGCVFTGTDNKLKYISFKSSGDARIELIQTPDF